MKFCAICGNEIKNFKKRRCSYCNADLANPKNVIERDINIAINRSNEIDKEKELQEKIERDELDYEVTEADYFNSNLKTHKKWITVLLQFLIGPTGASFFYTGRWIRGIIWLILNGLLCLLYLSFSYFAFFIIFGLNMLIAIFMLFMKQTDANGLELE